MESRGRVVEKIGAVESSGPNRSRALTAVRLLLCGALFFMLGVAHATTYVYDANGRVVAVTQSSGVSAQYAYDSVGNLVQVSQVAAGQLAIFAFTPTHGSAGTSVTLSGQGFSATASANLVQFNGAVASVSSASATQLVVEVPGGATTGAISVTTGGQTATSRSSFVVDNTGAPPTISQVSPAVVAVGSTITVTGTNLDPPEGAARVFLAGTQETVASLSDTQLQFSVPANAASGTVQVQTLYGQATSAMPVLVVPNGITPAQVASQSTAAVDGAGVGISIGQGGQTAALSFQGTSGAWLSLQGSAITTAANTIRYSIYGPGSQLIAQGALSASSPTIHLPRLTASGTYVGFFTPDTAGAQLTMGIESNPVLSTAAALAVAAAAPYQSKREVFTVTQGQNLELTLNNAMLPGSPNGGFVVDVYTAAGAHLSGPYCTGSCIQSLWNLAAGTYSVVATPVYGGTISFNALLEPDVVGPTIATGGTAAVNLSAGQVERLTFNAAAGDTIALNVTGVTTTPAGSGVTFMVYRPDAGAITTGTPTYTSFDTTSGQLLNLANLPVSGTYTVIVVPDNGLPATAAVGVVAGSIGTIPGDGTSGSYTANAAGENVYLSFAATQGENLELTLNNATVPGAGNGDFAVNIYTPNGVHIIDLICNTRNPASSCTQHLWNLAAGTYSAVATPVYGGTISFNALISADLSGPTIATGGTAAVNLSAGQVERLTFNATAGDTIALNVAGVTTTPADDGVSGVTFMLYRPDAGVITTDTSTYTSFDTGSGQLVNLANLPVSGTYTLIVAPDNGLPATATVGVVAGSTGTIPTNGTSGAYSANAVGENIYLSFAATQGENLELTLNNATAPGAGNGDFAVNIYTPNGVHIIDLTCNTSNPAGSCTQPLWNLAAGTYSVVATPVYGGTMRFNALLEPDIVGPVITTSGTAAVNLSAGQVERLTFNATAGDTIALNVTGVTTTPAGNGVTFLVYRPDVGTITTGTPTYTSFDTTSGQTVNLPNLPVGGAYTVIMAPDNGLLATASLGLAADTASPPVTYGNATLPATGVPQSAVAAAGQSVSMTFNAAQGDNLELTLSNVATGGSNHPVLVNVSMGAGVTPYINTPCYPTTTDSCRLALWNLAAGTYSVVVSPYQSTDTISFSAQLQPDVVGPALTANTPATINLAAGDVERLTFNASVGDTVALALSNFSTTPAGQDVYVDVYRPDGGAITTGNRYTSLSTNGTTMLNLPNLPAGGTYTLVAYTLSGVPATAQIAEYASATGTPTGTLPTDGTVQNYTTRTSGQNVYLTFNATQGQNLELTLSDISATHSVYVIVTTSMGPYAAGASCSPTTTTSCRLALWNLAAGTYAVVVSPTLSTDMISFSAQLQPDVVGPALTANTPATINLAAGGVERLTFNASLGDTVALALSNVSTTPAGQALNFNLYRPDGGAITLGNYYTSSGTDSATVVNLANLPAGGTYTLVVYTISGAPATAQIAEYTSATGTTTGTLPTNDTVENYTTQTSGQNVYLTFNATQGQNLELTLSDIGATHAVYVTVATSMGPYVAGASCSPTTTDSCRLALWNLAAGTYAVVVSPTLSTDMISFNAQLQPDAVGPALTANTPATINLAAGGVERLTFNASLGDTVALALSNVNTAPAGQTLSFNLYRPDGGAITAGNYYISSGTASSTMLTLPNLPAGGTYTLIAYTASGAPTTASLTEFATTGQPVTGTLQNFAATAAGQSIYLVFTPTQGQNLKLALTNLSVTGSTGNALQVLIIDSAGNTVANASCAVSAGVNCLIPVWKTLGSQYSVVVSPPDANSTISFGASLQQNVNAQ